MDCLYEKITGWRCFEKREVNLDDEKDTFVVEDDVELLESKLERVEKKLKKLDKLESRLEEKIKETVKRQINRVEEKENVREEVKPLNKNKKIMQNENIELERAKIIASRKEKILPKKEEKVQNNKVALKLKKPKEELNSSEDSLLEAAEDSVRKNKREVSEGFYGGPIFYSKEEFGNTDNVEGINSNLINNYSSW